jgi:hypothetical protein
MQATPLSSFHLSNNHANKTNSKSNKSHSGEGWTYQHIRTESFKELNRPIWHLPA